MQFPPSSCVSPIPFPLCAMLEGTHGTAPQGATLGTRIDRDISLIMPLRFVRQLRNNTAQSLVLIVKLGARCGRRRCGSSSEQAHSVYKYALNKCAIGANGDMSAILR